MIFLIIFSFLLFENKEEIKINYYLSSCDYDGFIKELENKYYIDSEYGWIWYVYKLKRGEFEKSEYIYKKDITKKIMQNKKYEIDLLTIFYKEKNYSEVIRYIKEYLKKEKGYESYKKIGIEGWIAVLFSSIIKGEKELIEYIISNKIKRGIYYNIGYYHLNKKLPTDTKNEDFGHPDKKSYMLYLENKIKKEELIMKIEKCYKDLPVWLKINIDLINSLAQSQKVNERN